MEEEAIGTMSQLGHVQYVPCARCGAFGPAGAMHVTSGDALEDHADYVYVCDTCHRAEADGEQEVLLPPE